MLARKTRASLGGPTERITDKDVDSLLSQLDALEKSRKNGKLTLPDGDTLEVTNLHKIFWPQGKKTKGDLIRHYARMAPYILPVIDNRPLVMKRLPNGVDAPTSTSTARPMCRRPASAARACLTMMCRRG